MAAGWIWHVVLITVLSTVVASATESNGTTFYLGVFAPITSIHHTLLAGAVAFDLDFRKHFEPELVERLGPPVVQIQNLHPDLRLHVIIGDSRSTPSVGLQTTLDWLLGIEPFPRVVGMVGGLHSSVTIPVAANSAVFKVPQISWGASSPSLSDKNTYPYFLRTFPSDDFQGLAFSFWLVHFNIPKAAFLYSRSPYGEGVFQATAEALTAQGEDARVAGTPVAYMPNEDEYDVDTAIGAVRRVMQLGTRFILLAMGVSESSGAMYAMELQGLLYKNYQFLGTETVLLQDTNRFNPCCGLPLGFMAFTPVFHGKFFPDFEKLWRNMTTDDCYGEEARQRYFLDHFRFPLEDGPAPMLSEWDFTTAPMWHWVNNFMFDSAYAFAIAINELLNRGVPPDDIHSEVLLAELFNTRFEGVSGFVEFDAKGDREIGMSLQNWDNQTGITTAAILRVVATYEPWNHTLVAHRDFMWGNGQLAQEPPADLFECTVGFEADPATGVCTLCRPGIRCGYDPTVGFPIGFYGPFTSLTQDFLAAAVAFDLDFRKNSEPQLRERLGDPIINISNLHPDLKIKVQLHTSDSDLNTAMQSTLNWFLGGGDVYRVAGIVGGYDSRIAAAVASNAAVFGVPQIAFGAASPTLSDKTSYPWLLRTIPSHNLLGQAQWDWMNTFGVPAVVLYHTRETYGEGLLSVLTGLAAAASQSKRVNSIGFEDDRDLSSDAALLAARGDCVAIRALGIKAVVLALYDSEHTSLALRAMELEGMLYGLYQFLGTETTALSQAVPPQYLPSQGMPAGLQRLQAVTAGDLFRDFEDMWGNLTSEDLYSPDAYSRYMMNHFLVHPDLGQAPKLTAANFAARSFHFMCPMIFDAAYTFAIAINNLLNSGTSPTDIHGQVLLTEIEKVQFEGVSGLIKYDNNGDREGDFELQHVQEQGANATLAAVWRGEGRSFAFPGPRAIMWANNTLSEMAPLFLRECYPGEAWDVEAGQCLSCQSGWFSTGGVQATCFACEVGSMSSQPIGATACEMCSAGRFRGLRETNCTECLPGSFATSPGQAECEDCSVGTYGNESGLSACRRCGSGRRSQQHFTTMTKIRVNDVLEPIYLQGAISEDTCGCDKHYHSDGSGECDLCVEGMICKGLDVILIEQGYYAGTDLSIFRCHGDDQRCKGGLPGETCADGRTGITCAECKDSLTPSSEGRCKECESFDQVPLVCFLLVAVLGLFGVYYLMDQHDRSKSGHALLLCTIAFGQLVTLVQHLGVVSMLLLEWQQPLEGLLLLASLLTLNFDILRPNCFTRLGPVMLYIAKLFLVVVVLVLMCIFHLVWVLFRHGGKFQERKSTLISVLGTMLMAFFISVASTVLEPLQCMEHPNEKYSVRLYPQVICFTADHRAMVTLGCIAFVCIPLAYLAGCIFVVRAHKAQMRAGNTEFLRAFAFLFTRFRVDHHAYSIVQMLRGLAVALVLLLPDVTLQVSCLQLVLLAGLIVVVYDCPWRVPLANMLDSILGAAALIVVCLAGLFVDDTMKKLDTVAWLSTILLTVSVVIAACAILYGVYSRFCRAVKPFRFFLCHHKASSGAFTRLLKMHLRLDPRVKTDIFIDCDNLENLDNLFNYVGNDTQTLVVVVTTEIFTRPWCLGEMCEAYLKHVQAAAVAMANSDMPDDNFIEQLEDIIGDGLEVVTENGMTVEMLQQALMWIRMQPVIQMPRTLSSEVMQELVPQLLTGLASITDREDSMRAVKSLLPAKPVQCCCRILYDCENSEASCTALITQFLLAPLLSHESEKIPEPIGSGMLPANTVMLLPLCMNGSFESIDFLKVLLQVKVPKVGLIPMIGESGFRFPSKGVRMSTLLPRGLNSDDINALSVLITSLFKEIAVTFLAQSSSEIILKVVAEDLAKRLLRRRGGAQGMNSNSHTPSGQHAFSKATTSSGPALEHSGDRGGIHIMMSSNSRDRDDGGIGALASDGSFPGHLMSERPAYHSQPLEEGDGHESDHMEETTFDPDCAAQSDSSFDC